MGSGPDPGPDPRRPAAGTLFFHLIFRLIISAMEHHHRIHVRPDNVSFDVAADQTLLAALTNRGILLRSDCGGKGKCGKCRVSITRKGQAPRESVACACRADGELTVDIPGQSRLLWSTMSKARLYLPPSFYAAGRGKADSARHGIAVDLGTTTIAAYLCELDTATVVASLAVKNPQAMYGDDVVNRIGAINASNGDVELLRQPVRAMLGSAIAQLCLQADVALSSVTELVAVGNPTMIHILTGASPETIGVFPYQPLFTESQVLGPGEHGLGSFAGRLHTLPLVSGFIGGDAVAACLAADLPHQPVGTLLIDLGTNGELMLLGRDGILATSCATGPAFEGATLSCGIQAVAGAIDRVELDGWDKPPRYRTIAGNREQRQSRPKGLCGSGVISALAGFLQAGIIVPSGKFTPGLKCPFIIKNDRNELVYEIASAGSGEDGMVASISQKDIRLVQLGKAALRAGIDQLLDFVGITAPEKIIIAGAFGSHIEPADMIALGMIPALPPSQIESVGNAAGGGAVMALCNPEYFESARQLATSIVTLDLAANPRFQSMFVERLSFPATGR